MSLALVCVCQECYGPVSVYEQLRLWNPEDTLGWTMTVESCDRCDWWRERERAVLAA